MCWRRRGSGEYIARGIFVNIIIIISCLVVVLLYIIGHIVGERKETGRTKGERPGQCLCLPISFRFGLKYYLVANLILCIVVGASQSHRVQGGKDLKMVLQVSFGFEYQFHFICVSGYSSIESELHLCLSRNCLHYIIRLPFVYSRYSPQYVHTQHIGSITVRREQGRSASIRVYFVEYNTTIYT